MAVEQSTEAQKLQVLVGELKENQSSFPAGVNVWSGKETGLVGALWEGSPCPWILRRFQALVPVFLLQHPLQPFLEMEQLRLARQLEGLRARLALGIREDTIPKLSSKDQEEGRGQGAGRWGRSPFEYHRILFPTNQESFNQRGGGSHI